MTEILPLVSYIVPCFNQGQFLYESLSSIMMSYKGPKEIIVIEDGSTDSSSIRKMDDYIKLFPSIKLIRHPKNQGLSATRNTGLNNSSGKYIQFLDADDLLIPDKVDYQVQHLNLGYNIDISLSNYYFSDTTLSDYSLNLPVLGFYELSLDDFLYKWERGFTIPIHSALFKKEVFDYVRFDESLFGKEDWLFWCSLAHKKYKISYINILGAIYRTHPNAMTQARKREMGRSWLIATLKIDEFLEQEKYEFLQKSILYFQNTYSYDMSKEVSESSKKRDILKEEHLFELISKSPFSDNWLKMEKSREPFFSVVIPIYNHYEYLVKCIESIVTQTNLNFELICVDDHSSDIRVIEFLSDLMKNFPNISIIFNEENEGIANSLNKAINNAQGEYIVFLDCDDYISKEALYNIYITLQAQPKIDYVFTNKVEVDENDQFIRHATYGGYSNIKPSGDIKNDLLDGMVASHLKVIRRSTIIDVGGFDPYVEGVQDYDLALRIAEKGRFFYLPKPLYFHRQHTKSVTKADLVSQFRKENIVRRRICEKWYPKKEHDDEILAHAVEKIISPNSTTSEYITNHNVALFCPKHYDLSSIKSKVINGFTCIFDARNEVIGDWIYFLRNYNSYFDCIIVNDSLQSMFLMSYLYDYQILKIVNPSWTESEPC